MTEVLVRPQHKDRHGQWRCLACGHWLKNSLEIAVHIRNYEPLAGLPVRRGMAACTSERIVFECEEHGQEAP